MTGIRWRETGLEGKCEYCREWWPVDNETIREFWTPEKLSFRMCKACTREYYRLAQARRRDDPEKRERDRIGVQEMRETLKKYGLLGEYRHRWYVRNREKVCASRRAKYARQRAEAGMPYTPKERAA